MRHHNAVKGSSMAPMQLLDLLRFLDSQERFLLASDSIFQVELPERRLDCS
jgi:hypothetical protein